MLLSRYRYAWDVQPAFSHRSKRLGGSPAIASLNILGGACHGVPSRITDRSCELKYGYKKLRGKLI